MKIVQIVNSITAGGAERLVLDLHREYLRLGHESYIVALASVQKAEGEGGFWSTGCRSPYAPAAAYRLSGFFRSEPLAGADIVHVHLFPALLRVPGALRRAGWQGKLFASEHSTFNRRRGTLWGSLTDNFTYRPYESIVCVSEAVRQAVVGWKPFLHSRAVVIHNGARLELFKPPERIGFHNPPVVLSVGRLTAAKNYRLALEAAALLVSGTENRFKWLIAGDGSTRSELEELASELSLDGFVEFLGTREDVPQLMRDSDIFFIPSAWEGFGIAAVEAMASGLPVVAGNVPGLREVVGNKAGMLVDPSSSSEMAAALEKLLCDSDSALQMGLSGPEKAADYSLEACALAHIDLFSGVL
ncbi:MAG: glycosyltransferase family 4 protein [Candidatus Fermentibacteria bacterium]|nr:glycosyltransferase family 4 protein [Candidatus Fermentibacteria bacterium]